MPRDQLSTFREFLRHVPAAAYLCDAEGLITYYNEYAVNLWGRTPLRNDPADRYCGSFKLFSSEGIAIRHDECWMALALRTGEDYHGKEILIERPDGKLITVLAHASPVRSDEGEIIGAVNVLIDITERKWAEVDQARLAAIVESSHDAIISKTLDGKVVSWNRGAEQLFGYSADEMVGRSITTLMPTEIVPEEASILARLRRGERIENYETVRVTKDGRRLEVSLTVSPVRDASGRIVGASKVARDISLRKRSAIDLLTLKDELATQLADLRRLHAMSVRLSTTLDLPTILDETLRTAVAFANTDLGLLYLCDSEQNELRTGASIGFDAEFLAKADDLPPGVGACGACFERRERVVVEDTETDPIFAGIRELPRLAGFRSVHSTPMITRSGRIVGVLSTHYRQVHKPSDREMHLIDLCARQAVDFIENARLYDRLREADRRKDEFLATLAHELRNPLAPISNSLNLLRISDDLSPTVEHVRDILERQVGHMVRLVDDLLEISRITRGKIELRKELIDLTQVISSAVEASRPLIEAAGHQLAIALASETIMLEADPVRLAQVISNLLNNAAKYTAEGGQIWVSARRDGGDVLISVRDTGFGIPDEMLPRVFDLFAQVDRTLERAQGGLGIGLSLSKTLIEMHQGTIEAQSDGPGKGSEFLIRLPIQRGTSKLAPPLEQPTAERVVKKLPPHKILVVDDTRDAVYIVGKMLEAMGQQVRTTQSGKTAIELAIADPPDMIISDIGMPELDGHELARLVRKHPDLENVVLVALTGYGQESDRQVAIEAGFDQHLVKPISMDALENLLALLPSKSNRTPA